MKTCQKNHKYGDEFKTCPTCKKEYRKDYYAKNKDREKSVTLAWIEKNRESYLQSKRKKHKEDKQGQQRWYRSRLEKRPYDSIWRAMINRCYKPKHHKYPDYGARGIKVCDRWRGEGGYQNFESDMGPRPSPLHTIDRTNNDGNYEPGNTHWATKKAQQRNRRKNALVTLAGRTQCVAAWAEEIGISNSAFAGRMRAGWSEERMLSPNSQPYQKGKRQMSGFKKAENHG